VDCAPSTATQKVDGVPGWLCTDARMGPGALPCSTLGRMKTSLLDHAAPGWYSHGYVMTLTPSAGTPLSTFHDAHASMVKLLTIV